MHVTGSVQIANASQVLADLAWNDIDIKGMAGLKVSKKGIDLKGFSGLKVSENAKAFVMLDNGLASKCFIAREQVPNHQFLPPQSDNVPEALKSLARWLLWQAESVNGEKPRKVPYCPTLPNSRGSSTDPATWGTFEQAVAAFEEGGRTGLGFVLNGDGLVGIDIDNCVVDKIPNPSALSLLEQLGCGYVEFSPSGTGLRGFGYSEGLSTGVKGKYSGLDVELYSTGRYLTVTGHTVIPGQVVQLRGFRNLAEQIRADRVGSSGASETGVGASIKRHGELVRRILSGDVYHDSLRDLAASLVASGMNEGAVVNHLRGLMENTSAANDERWQARMAEIPKLVDSAVRKFSPQMVDLRRFLQSPDAAAENREPTNRFKVLTAAEIAQAKPIKWTVRGLLPQVGLAALYGPSGSGKSFLTLDLSASVASGVAEWYGMRVTQCPVTYCVLEGEGGMGKRVAAWEKYKAKKMPAALRFVVQQFDITVAADVEELAFAIRDAGGADGLIVLDTLNRAAPGTDENSSKDMGVIIANAKALQQLTGGMVLLVHHTGKDESKGMRGHSSLFAAMDCVIGVVRGNAQGLSWTVAKSKDDETGTLHPFRLDQVVVAQDDEGDDITSCVAVSIAPPLAQRGARKLGQNQQVARDVLRGLFDKAPDGLPITYAAAYGAIADAIDVDPKHKRERAKQAVTALANHGMIELTETHIVRLPALGD